MDRRDQLAKATQAPAERVVSDIYTETLRKNRSPRMVLREFQLAVAEVPKWTRARVEAEFARALRLSPRYSEIAAAAMRAQVKAALPPERVPDALEALPDTRALYHACLCEVARDMYRYPSLVFHNVDTHTRRANREQMHDIIAAAAMKALADAVPEIPESDEDDFEPDEQPGPPQRDAPGNAECRSPDPKATENGAEPSTPVDPAGSTPVDPAPAPPEVNASRTAAEIPLERTPSPEPTRWSDSESGSESGSESADSAPDKAPEDEAEAGGTPARSTASHSDRESEPPQEPSAGAAPVTENAAPGRVFELRSPPARTRAPQVSVDRVRQGVKESAWTCPRDVRSRMSYEPFSDSDAAPSDPLSGSEDGESAYDDLELHPPSRSPTYTSDASDSDSEPRRENEAWQSA